MLELNLKITMILLKNSLLTPMFREDILWLHERRIMQNLKWKGGVISGKNDFEKNILSVGQIALVYFIMTLALLISFVCFSREFLANNKLKQPTFKECVGETYLMGSLWHVPQF